MSHETNGRGTDSTVLPPFDVQARAEAMAAVRAWNDAYVEETGKRRGVYVLTFGCQQNEADSEKITGTAEAMGYVRVSAPELADLIMVNTCAVREHAENRALSIIGGFKALKKQNPALVIGVCGCMVSQEHRRDSIRHSYPYVTFTLGTSSLHHFPQVLWSCLDPQGKHHRSILSERQEDMAFAVDEGLPVCRTSSYRAWVSIMYGCNNFCSYCIVPYVRGRERSRKKDDIVREVRELVASGYRDITLLGQNVNSYGKGLEEPCDFADLLAALDEIPGDWWLRFMTSHPKDASRKLIDVMSASVRSGGHIVPAFHLPLQSGSDSILRVMNRHYDMAKYMDTVTYMKEKIDGLTLTSDIIVGFPGETEEDFEATLTALHTIRYDMLYAFIYSPRKGTPAADMDPVPEAIRKSRFERLIAQQNDISLALNQPLVGTVQRVLCDGESKTDASVYTGRNYGNKSVFFEGTPDMVGRFVRVVIERAAPYALYGRVVEA